MDRVLLVFDDLQYSGHLEMTLRKIGFDTETITNEYNLSEKLLTFNPDYIIVKGNSARVSGLQMGKKLKESVKYSGKVILIFPQDLRPKPEDLIKLRMDLLLFEPMTALRLVGHLLTLTTVDREAIMDKLLRIANTDTKFREYEQQIISNTGASIDSEIQLISASLKSKTEDTPDLDENLIQSFVDPDFKTEVATDLTKRTTKVDTTASTEKSEPLDPAFNAEVSPEYIQSLKGEIEGLGTELPLRIETYNRAIKRIDQDLKSGLSKRHTKKAAKESMSAATDLENKSRDDERKDFANALWKKDKE